MKHMINHPICGACMVFILLFAVMMSWITHRPEIQQALRTAQELLFWWQQ